MKNSTTLSETVFSKLLITAIISFTPITASFAEEIKELAKNTQNISHSNADYNEALLTIMNPSFFTTLKELLNKSIDEISFKDIKDITENISYISNIRPHFED